MLYEKNNDKWSNNYVNNEGSHNNYVNNEGSHNNDEIESSSNDAQVHLNNKKITYQLCCRSSMQCVREKYPNSVTLFLLKEESGLEEIIPCKVIDESHTWNVKLTNLDPCENDPILYTIGTSGTWTRSIDDVFPILMVYADDSVKLMLYQPSLSEIKS